MCISFVTFSIEEFSQPEPNHMQNALELATNAMQNRGRERTAQQFRAEHDKMLKNLPSMPDSHPVKTQVEEEIKFEQEIVS